MKEQFEEHEVVGSDEPKVEGEFDIFDAAHVFPVRTPVEGTKPVPSPEAMEEYYGVLQTHPQVIHPTPRSVRFPINIT